MKISESKTVISSLSEHTNWQCEGIDAEDYSFADSVAFAYLGVRFKVKGRDYLDDQYRHILTKADRYMYAIMHTTKESLDQALTARSLWLFCAIPAVLYGSEACVLGKKVLKELEQRQKRIASFITGLPVSGGNVALSLDSIGFSTGYLHQSLI